MSPYCTVPPAWEEGGRDHSWRIRLSHLHMQIVAYIQVTNCPNLHSLRQQHFIFHFYIFLALSRYHWYMKMCVAWTHTSWWLWRSANTMMPWPQRRCETRPSLPNNGLVFFGVCAFNLGRTLHVGFSLFACFKVHDTVLRRPCTIHSLCGSGVGRQLMNLVLCGGPHKVTILCPRMTSRLELNWGRLRLPAPWGCWRTSFLEAGGLKSWPPTGYQRPSSPTCTMAASVFNQHRRTSPEEPAHTALDNVM